MTVSVSDFISLIESPQHPNRQGYDSLTLRETMERLGVPGLSVAVIKDFKIHWAKGYGLADVASQTPVSENTLFQAASISKPLNAMAILKAAQDGLLSLDSDISTLVKSCKLPENQYAKDKAVTPRMLASHTSGLGDGFGFPGYSPTDQLPTIAEIISGAGKSNVEQPTFSRAPFEAFKYSGAGSLILQQILMDVLSDDYDHIMQKWVLDPLGMNNSTYSQPLPQSKVDIAARAHGNNGETMDSMWRVYPELAAAGLWTTPSDLARFIIEIQASLHNASNRILDQHHVNLMVNPVGVGDYGVGFRLLKEGQGWYFEHGGGNWGFRCRAFAHKLKGYGFVMMTNGSQGTALMNVTKERIEWHYGWDSIAKPSI